MAKNTLARIAAGVAILCFAGAAVAQQTVCGERDRILKVLEKEYGETLAGTGVLPNGTMLELHTSPDGSFTVLVTLPNGPTCIRADGTGWRDAPKGRAS